MPAAFFPDVTCFANANAKQTELALSVIKLFQEGFTPNNMTVVTDLDGVECDYDDYAPATITAWLEPTVAAGGGASISAPTSQFLCTADQVVSNSVGGYWIETAAGAIVMIRQFDNPVPMMLANQYVRIAPTYFYPNGG